MEDRQHRAVTGRIEKLVSVPACGQRTGLGFAVADHRSYDEIGIVERCTIRVRERVTEFTALMDRAGSLRRNVAWDPAGERELFEQLLHAVLVPGDVRIYLAVCTLQ